MYSIHTFYTRSATQAAACYSQSLQGLMVITHYVLIQRVENNRFHAIPIVGNVFRAIAAASEIGGWLYDVIPNQSTGARTRLRRKF